MAYRSRGQRFESEQPQKNGKKSDSAAAKKKRSSKADSGKANAAPKSEAANKSNNLASPPCPYWWSYAVPAEMRRKYPKHCIDLCTVQPIRDFSKFPRKPVGIMHRNPSMLVFEQLENDPSRRRTTPIINTSF